MNWLQSLMFFIQIVAALLIIVLVLMQQSSGSDMGSAFGNASSSSFFGASGSANFLSRTTAFLAVVFFASTLFLTYLNAKKPELTAGVIGSTKRSLTNLPVTGANSNKRSIDHKKTSQSNPEDSRPDISALTPSMRDVVPN